MVVLFIISANKSIDFVPHYSIGRTFWGNGFFELEGILFIGWRFIFV